MHHALSLSIIRGRGDVVTRFILLLSADAHAMQFCKQGLVLYAIPFRSELGALTRLIRQIDMDALLHRRIEATRPAISSGRVMGREHRPSTQMKAADLSGG
jgi:hypothetical protein